MTTTPPRSTVVSLGADLVREIASFVPQETFDVDATRLGWGYQLELAFRYCLNGRLVATFCYHVTSAEVYKRQFRDILHDIKYPSQNYYNHVYRLYNCHDEQYFTARVLHNPSLVHIVTNGARNHKSHSSLYIPSHLCTQAFRDADEAIVDYFGSSDSEAE